jgi:hypothetical protein
MRGKISKFLESNENKNNVPEPLGYRKGNADRKVY